MPKQPEGKLAGQIRHRLQERGARPFKIQGVQGSFQEVGIPDFLVCYRGCFVALEVKMPGEEPKPRQAIVLRSVRDAGGHAAVVTSVEGAESVLDAVDADLDA